MAVFAISDLHLSFETDKPMDVFGEKWENYENRIIENAKQLVKEDDILLIAGDLSWAMQIEDASKDFEYIKKLPGIKVLIRGNHDYWWKAISTVRDKFEDSRVYALQNDSVKFGRIVIAGTRGWIVPEPNKALNEQDKKIYDRELIRLEMALQNASLKRLDGDKLVVLLHFPPFNSEAEENEFTKLLERYKVDICVYGHLHGKTKYKSNTFEINGIKYILSSADKINFNPIQIL